MTWTSPCLNVEKIDAIWPSEGQSYKITFKQWESRTFVKFSQFDNIKARFGRHASFAVWEPVRGTPTSGTGDLDLFQQPKVLRTLQKLKTDTILFGLNISRALITEDFANFHDGRGRSKDYKLRYALEGTQIYGSYLTDVFKDVVEVESAKFDRYLKDNPQVEKTQIEYLEAEINYVARSAPPVLIGMGGSAHKYLQRHFGHSYKIIKIPHYAMRNSKENYREQVLATLAADL